MNYFSTKICMVGLVIFLLWWSSPARAGNTMQFSMATTAETGPLQGQIDWPHGKLKNWKGSVVIFISSGIPNDRDGWLVRALETVWADRMPLKELSRELVKKDVAVVRFDNPGVLSPSKKCRETTLKTGLTQSILWQRCLDLQIIQSLTPEKYLDHIEKIIWHVREIMPDVHGKLVLFGFSEGLMHAAALADREGISVDGLISIGSPAERFDTISRWQGTERIFQALDRFDLNSDGIITNEEIREGYGNGVNRFMSLSGWLSSEGQWTSNNRHLLADFLARSYEQILEDYKEVTGAGKLDWKRQTNGVEIPDMTSALWRLHFYGQISAAEVMQRLTIPGMFIWGGQDQQVGVSRQIAFIEKANSKGADVIYRCYPERHHLLSKSQDLDWMETEFMPTLAEEVASFLKLHVRPSR